MKSNRGSALLVAILLSAILLAALAGLLTVALNEYRGSLKSYLNTAAFSLAESGIDRAAAAIVDKTVFTTATEINAWPDETSTFSGWYKKSGTTTYRGYFPKENLEKGRKGVCSVTVTPNGTTLFDVYAQGCVTGGTNGEIVAERALYVKLERTSTASANSGYALAAISKITLATSNCPVFKVNDGGGFVRIASYDSSKGSPNLYTDFKGKFGVLSGSNIDDNAVIAVQTGTMNLQNAIIYGKVAAGTGATIENNEWSGQRKEIYGQTGQSKYDEENIKIKNAVLVNVDIAKTNSTAGIYRGYNLDANASEMAAYDQKKNYSETELKKAADSCILANYTIDPETFNAPDRSKLAGYTTQPPNTKDANGNEIKQGGVTALTLDGSKASYYTNYDSNALNVSAINVSGTVLLYVKNDFKAENGLTINYADSSSRLIIYSDGAVRIKMASCPTYKKRVYNEDHSSYSDVATEIAPKQLEINVANGSDVQFWCAQSALFAGVVKAPKSKVSIESSGQGHGRDCADATAQMAKRLQIRGQIIANSIDLTGSNNLDILYDEQIKGNTTSATKLGVASWKQILPSAFAAQL